MNSYSKSDIEKLKQLYPDFMDKTRYFYKCKNKYFSYFLKDRIDQFVINCPACKSFHYVLNCPKYSLVESDDYILDTKDKHLKLPERKWYCYACRNDHQIKPDVEQKIINGLRYEDVPLEIAKYQYSLASPISKKKIGFLILGLLTGVLFTMNSITQSLSAIGVRFNILKIFLGLCVFASTPYVIMLTKWHLDAKKKHGF